VKIGYLLLRIVQIVPTLCLISLAVFVLSRAMPGDPVANLLGDRATPELVKQAHARLGLDRPLWIQFGAFISLLVQGEFGMSITQNVPVISLIWSRVPVTLLLTAMASVFALILAVPLAFVSAIYEDRWPDQIIRAVFQVGLSAPVFSIGLVLLTVFAAWLKWFPVGGYGNDPLSILHHLFLPAVTLALSFAAVIMRSLRASIISVLQADYVDLAIAKGLPWGLIMRRHIFRNAALATLTLTGMQVGQLLGGAVITESVFAVPGVGRLMVDSIFARDYPTVQALTLFLAVFVSLAFLATDLVQMGIDPRAQR
jgi:peptide/nickel transport system permease protein